MKDPKSDSESRPANRLARETSTYLRQHMHNPVDWHPWGEEALRRARDEDRPLLVSIGYSACHWCHVMERESFEDAETAALMNELYVNIKVDREERPDVDQIYMDAVVRLTGQGGWPLTVFCTPDGRPFYGGTYFPPEPRHSLPAFREVLRALHDAYRERRGEVERSASQILTALSQRSVGTAQVLPGTEPLARAVDELLREADAENGGFGGAPKFPTPTNLELLLLASEVLPDEAGRRTLEHVLRTCREMSRRGLYDHLGGGFHRYCVDARWTIPHFEKMLYDQGLLLAAFAEAWRRSGDPDLLWPIRETAHYLSREMKAPEGGFFASQDADSEGEEGRFYVWQPAAIEAALGPRADAFCEAYSVTPEGNFEGRRSHLVDLTRQDRRHFAEERAVLLAARSQRIPPTTDRKRVAAWNGYAISGLSRSGSLLADTEMLGEARQAADFVLSRMIGADATLLRVFDAGRAAVKAFLDDHAALLGALLDLHRAGVGDRYLAAAIRIAEQIVQRFFDDDSGDLFLTPADGEPLIQRPRSDHDGATPHAAGHAVLGLLRAAELSGRSDFRQVAERVLRTHFDLLERAPRAFPTLVRAAALAARGLSTAVILGDPDDPSTLALADRARRVLLPEDSVITGTPGATSPEDLDPTWLEGRSQANGTGTAILCHGTTCSLPCTDPDSLERIASSLRSGRIHP